MGDKPIIAFPDGSIPETPWDGEAALYAQETGLPLDECHDFTIAKWLMQGDTRALEAWLNSKRIPGMKTLAIIRWMLRDDPGLTMTTPSGKVVVPPRLVVKDRRGRKGNRRNPEKTIRDFILAENMARLIPKTTYDGAVATLKQAARETGAAISDQTIRDAYDTRYGKKTRN